MGLIYKVGNTIQGLPFPEYHVSSKRKSTTLSLFISVLLLLLQCPVVIAQPNLGMSAVATLQFIITGFLILFLISDSFQDRKKLQKFRFLYFFLGGFFIALGCSYILVDAFTLLQPPLHRIDSAIWVTCLITLLGNISIVQILCSAKIIPFKIKALQIPFFSIIIFTVVNLIVLFLMIITQWWQLGLWIGTVEVSCIGMWGFVIFMDAYWKIVEIDKSIIN